MTNFTIIDKINARASKPIKDIEYDEKGEFTVKVTAIDIEVKDIKGEQTKVSYFKTENGYFCTTSTAVNEQIEEIAEAMGDVEDGEFPDMNITFIRKKSNAGKTFYQIRIEM